MSTFRQLGIPADLVKGLDELGIITPTEVQARSIPYLLKSGGDFVAQAQTGTGKTAAFGLPLITKIDPKAKQIQGLVIAPTRELAKQIAKQIFRYTKYYGEKIFVETLTGGEPMEKQIANLQRPTHIVVATPGRLLDLLKKKALTLIHVKHLVLDEADEMLSMGFKKELVSIFGLTRQRRSTWLFSATFPDSLQTLVKGSMHSQPEMLKVDKAHVVNQNIDHRYAVCGKDEKNEFISEFLDDHADERGLIFVRTKAGAIALGRQLEKFGIPVDVIQGDLSQRERDKVLRGFRNKRTRILIATDVAARGIDVEGLSFVIHYQLPEQFEYYTHRSGRTARAGKKGTSIALIDPRERKKIAKFEEALGVDFTEMG
ncbi:DEAD/DEAH box helicase [Luteolibacter algae]|uniref:DEAD/DEAH box helicase n=1 Tax=Luteolibacter algae TaxID=454151 RepID=A0ABW5D8J5_9BACT